MVTSHATFAQDFVITIKGDTLKGNVKPVNSGSEKKVVVINDQKQKTTISIFQTLEYVYRGETFRPVRNEKGYVFMKLIKGGYLSLYAFQIENQSNYDGQFLTRKDGKNLEVPNLGFKKIVTKYLADCSVVVDKINDGTLGKSKMNQIVDEFNQCIANNTVSQKQIIVAETVSNNKLTIWNTLEDKVKSHPDFKEKPDALEMIGDVKNKVQHGEKIPNFLIEGLKGALSQTDLKEDLDNNIKELN